MRILIMGLPGSGKTTLASELSALLFPNCLWLNADEIRKEYNDWDFSEQGRIRQSERMRKLANESKDDYVIADFVCPLPVMRDIYNADITIWMDTIQKSEYEDTNSIFKQPTKYDFRVKEKNFEKWSEIIFDYVRSN